MDKILKLRLLFQGMGGSSKQNYVTHFVNKAKKKNCIAVVMNYRGIKQKLNQ
jgi:predicted alpha/beta-fold hydrolase